MWMDRRGGLFIRTTALEPGKTAASPVDSRTSLSTISVDSLASNDTVAGMSIETSATSFIDTSDAGHRNISGASSSIAQYLTLSERMKIAKSTTVITQNTRASGSQIRTNTSRASGAMAPIEAKGPVRVVGRGGQGSRPRLVGPEGTALTTPQPLRSPTYEMGAPARLDNTRIVGRGGMGSRPRDLPAPAPVVVPLPKQTQAPAQVVVYRPGGRGGAGSKPRAPKPPSEVRDKGKGKSPPFAWKGKGKETGNASTYGAPSLTRTDTLDSMGNGSVIQFLPVRGPQRIYQSTVGQDPIPEVPFEGGSGASVDIGARRTGRLHKLLRPRRTETPSSHSTGTRASSVSGLSIGSDAADSMSLDNTSGRRTNYESTPPIPVFQYPKPPRPPPAFPTDLESELQDDTQSEILSCDYDTNSDDHSESCDASSVCPTPLHFEPSLESDADGDYDPYWDRARTPTAMRPDEKHLSVPFQTLVLSPPTWDSADTVVRNEVGWTGEWNCGDIREVISSLRELR